LILAIPDPNQRLFHSVSKTFTEDRHIFRFHPSKGQHVRGVVTGLLVFLKGMGSDHMDTKKFHKFLMKAQSTGPLMHGGTQKLRQC